MERWVGKVAVVTGASAGIGLFTAKALVEQGMIVVGLARRKAKMEEGMKNVKGKGKFYAIECDVTKESSVIEAFESIKKKFGSVHVLVNNAGRTTLGGLAAAKVDQLEQVVNVNILGVLYCTRQAVNIMKEGKHEGHIVNVGSVLGHKVLNIPAFPLNIYPATKFAIRAFSETLQNELSNEDLKIRVTHISPGAVKTEFLDAAGADPAFAQNLKGLNADDVADAIVYAIGTKPHVLVPEITLMPAEKNNF